MLPLISNTFDRNHGEHLTDLIAGADEVVLVSPFVFDDFADWVDRVDCSTVRRLTLVTTLAPRGDDQLRKPAALLSLIDAMRARYKRTSVRVQVDNRLHGKIYLAGREGKFVRGILTSANLTRSGLGGNHEWGVYSEDGALLAELWRQIDAAVEYPDVSETLLREMVKFVESYLNRYPKAVPTDIDVGLLNALARAPRKSTLAEAMERGRGVRRVFLKPQGTAERPVRKADRESFESLEQELSFPRKPVPKDVRPGDMLIAFATGERSVLGVFRVLREAEEHSSDLQASDADIARWPWFVAGENLTPRLGGRWWDVDVSIDQLEARFHAQTPAAALTEAGGMSLHALNYGAGRLRLNEAFGEFAVEQLLALEGTL